MSDHGTMPLTWALRWLSGACGACLALSPAVAQQQSFDVNAQPVVVEPLPPPGSPVRSQGKRASDAAEIGRDLDAASRRVQSDNLRNEIKRGDDTRDRDRVQTERRRATSVDRQESERLRREYGLREAEHERWRTDKERQRQDAASKQVRDSGDAKEENEERDTYVPIP